MISHEKRKLFRNIWRGGPAKEDCAITGIVRLQLQDIGRAGVQGWTSQGGRAGVWKDALGWMSCRQEWRAQAELHG